MFFRLTLAATLVVLIHAEPPVHQAISSQTIIHHNVPTKIHQAVPQYQSAPQYHSVPQYHSAPHYQVVPQYHSAPVYEHEAPIQYVQAPAHQVISAPIVQKIAPGHAAHVEEAPAHYEFSYSVEDPHTGDKKSQHESRNGDLVQGEYQLLQPDGITRKVEYSADKHNGFNAIVHNSAPTVHAAPVHAQLFSPAQQAYDSYH